MYTVGAGRIAQKMRGVYTDDCRGSFQCKIKETKQEYSPEYNGGVTLKTTPVSKFLITDTGSGYMALNIRHRSTFAAHASDGHHTPRVVLGWSRAVAKTVVQPKRLSSRESISK